MIEISQPGMVSVKERLPQPQTLTLESVTKTQDTLDTWFRWMNDPEILQYMYSTDPYTYEEIVAWMDRVMEDPRRHYFTITADKTPVGLVTLRQDQAPSNSAEIGIIIGEKDYWGKGIGTLTLESVLDYAQNEANLSTIRAMIRPQNERSIALFTKSGFHEVADVTVNGVPMIRFEKHLSRPERLLTPSVAANFATV